MGFVTKARFAAGPAPRRQAGSDATSPAGLEPAAAPVEPGGLSTPALVAAAPDLALGATFLVTWIWPTALREGMVAFLIMVMLLEFIIMHSSAFMGSVIVSRGGRAKKSIALLALGGFYSLFAGAFSISFRSWWPLLNFWGLTINRLLGVLIGQAPSGEEKQFVTRGWAVSVLSYLAFAGLTCVFPIPRLGITPEVIEHQHLPGTGVWIDQPHRAIAFGFLYFTAVGVSELFDHAWMSESVIPSRHVSQKRAA